MSTIFIPFNKLCWALGLSVYWLGDLCWALGLSVCWLVDLYLALRLPVVGLMLGIGFVCLLVG